MKKTIRQEEVKKTYTQHLNRVKGQVEGVVNLIANDAYCLDVINQINAIRGSLLSVSKKLVNEHIDGCVKNGHNSEEHLEEIKDLIDKLSK
ncbi:copper-sensing transcriptional repressor [Spiroplasma chinense]|uniref:Copper-sensing transcriptional repressor n=1 Tax=Spiroplasma chinense TaxID=216932 RepID=A0A5B9Y3Q2_9MOLU|nr:metal-sensitive transcriptional regulator [Spiroplasma chinense]QEH61383.1 copper-sensing transcriptional repressor [Spiroplasma chinense]